MPEVITSLLSDNRNSYISLADATAYHDTRLHNAEWTAATDENRQRALIWSTRLLDQNFRWRGSRVDEDQPLQFPRYNVYDYDGFYVEEDEIPKKLRDATAELALLLLTSDRTLSDEPDTQGIRELNVGTIGLKFNAVDRHTVIPNSIRDMVSEFIMTDLDSPGTSVRLTRT